MSNFKYAHPSDNIAPDATVTVQAGSAATGYGAAYLTDLSDANLGRPALASGTNISFQLDFGAPVTIVAIVVWSNAGTALDVRWQGNSSASWGAPPLNAGVEILGQREDEFFYRVWKDLTGESGYAAYRYYLLKFPTNTVPPGAKLLCLAQLRTLDRNFDWKDKQPDFHGSIAMETDGGAGWAYDLQMAARGLSANCEWASDTDRAKLLALWRATGGAVKPWVALPFPDLNDPWIVRFGTSSSPGRVSSAGPVLPSLDPTRKHFKMSSIPLVLNEVTAGGPEWL